MLLDLRELLLSTRVEKSLPSGTLGGGFVRTLSTWKSGCGVHFWLHIRSTGR